MHRITLSPPRVHRDGATFAWQVEPPTELYGGGDGRHAFRLRLPAGYDARRLPETLWWTVALLCLHSHWNLLRPCRVVLPVTLPRGQREFWLRLLASELATLDAHRATEASAPGAEPPPEALPEPRDVELLDQGPAL